MNYHAMKRVLLQDTRDSYFDTRAHKVHVNLLNFEHHPAFEVRKAWVKTLARLARLASQ